MPEGHTLHRLARDLNRRELARLSRLVPEVPDAPLIGSGGGADVSMVLIQRRESAGSICLSRTACVVHASALIESSDSDRSTALIASGSN